MQALLQRVEDLRAPAHRLAQRVGAVGDDHEFLEVDRVVGMLAAVDDVHHRHRQHVRLNAADVAIERQAAALGRRLGDREADAEDRVGAEARLVLGAVELDHRGVDLGLLFRLEVDDGVGDLAVHGLHSLQDALAQITAVVPVALLDRLMRTGRRARGHGGATEAAVIQRDIDLDGGIAAAVENFAGVDVDDGGHGDGSSGEGG